jgi:hypothetical protein
VQCLIWPLLLHLAREPESVACCDLAACGEVGVAFLIAATTIGREMGLLDPAVAAGLVAAGLVSVLVFPAVAVVLLSRVVEPVAP